MSVGPGTRLGPYQIQAAIGAGGMGEVYRARDTKLGRDVALKILPEVFALDAERLARFEREAKTLAALNHTHIAQIHGIEESGPVRALVMELVEGEDLAQRIARGPIPPDEALGIARQIAEALDAAHEQGIVHRDLKPANIKVRPDAIVKVLDFGLAKALDPAATSGAAAALANSPTITSPAAMTAHGVILGTAAYMSPEQARGKAVDKRADIWAFGCVLYEMLTGRQAFAGDTVTDTLAAVVRAEPDWSALPAGTPPGVRRLLRRCLEKDRRKRLRELADGLADLDDVTQAVAVIDATQPQQRFPRGWLWLASAAAGGLVLGGAAAWMLKRIPPPEPRTVVRFSMPLEPGLTLDNVGRRAIAISPDGQTIAYATNLQLFFRSIGAPEPRLGPRPTSPTNLFFSPDGQWLGYVDAMRLVRVRTGGGSPEMIAPLTTAPYGAAWTDRDTIVLSAVEGVMEVPASGGAPQQLIPSAADHVLMWPDVLPGGDVLLLTRVRRDRLHGEIVAYSRESREVRVVVPSGFAARYSKSGHLVYFEEGNLFSVAFDPARLVTSGSPVLLAQSIGRSGTDVDTAPQFDISQTGVVLYAGTDAVAVTERSRLVWVDRRGTLTPISDEQRAYSDPRFSPDGSRLALHLQDRDNDVWIRDQTRGTLTRVSFDAGEDETPVWSPDGKWLAFTAMRSRERLVLRTRTDGVDAEETLWTAPGHAHVSDWSPDGKVLLLDVVDPKMQWDIWALTMDGQPSAKPLLQSRFAERNGRISPDGRWLAYVSDQSGQAEVYVQPFPSLGQRWQVSTKGGQQPVWSPDGKQLFYRSTDSVMAVGVTTDTDFGVSSPTQLFPDRFHVPQGMTHVGYDVAPDGRFLMLLTDGDGVAADRVRTSLNIVVNWMDAR